jgi:hypothetical protein
MSESVILCEGYHDRAFWDGWLTCLGCNSDGFKPGTTGYPALDPWNDPVRGGQFAYRSLTGSFVRIRPCHGKSNVVKVARIRLTERTTKQLVRLVINIDVDTPATSTAPAGLSQQNVLNLVQQFDSAAAINSAGEIEMDAGATKVSLIRWETPDPPTPGLPDQQTLERLVSAALVAAYPDRGPAVQNWLAARPGPPDPDPKEHAWSYMAGWYAGYGCEAFYSNLWSDPGVAAELEQRLRASGAWNIAETLGK